MRLRIKERQAQEPTAELYLEDRDDEVSLICLYPDGRNSSLAYFDTDTKTFHVFDEDIKRLGYTLTHG